MKQYLKKIYGMDTIKVNSNVRLGKRKRDQMTGRSYRKQLTKNMIVTIDNTSFLEEFSERAVTGDMEIEPKD